jgi:hypothetical protein
MKIYLTSFFRIHLLDYEEKAMNCFQELGLDFVPYEPETFSRRKREYIDRFNNMTHEMSDVGEFFGVLLKSHELFINLVEVN